MSLGDFKKAVEIRRTSWRRFLNNVIFENSKTENEETETQTKIVLDQKPREPIFKFSKIDKPVEPNVFFYRRVPPAEPCELCGGYPTEYVIKTDDGSILRRCPKCFEELRRMLTKVKWVHAEEL